MGVIIPFGVRIIANMLNKDKLIKMVNFKLGNEM